MPGYDKPRNASILPKNDGLWSLASAGFDQFAFATPAPEARSGADPVQPVAWHISQDRARADLTSLGLVSTFVWDTSSLAPAATGDGAGPDAPRVVQARHVVFIDSAVHDADLLALGVNPGVEAVMLPSGQDGVVAIAAWLLDHAAQGLGSISIVAHGADGVLILGNAALETPTLPRYQQALAQIGASLAESGDIRLYGCDVAQSQDGLDFIRNLSDATGGADVAAASHMVGSADNGGSFELDINYGFVESDTPFTQSAQSSFIGELPTGINEIYYTTTGADSTTLAALRVAQIGVSGTIQTGGSVTLRSASQEAVWNRIPSVVADPAADKYFVIDSAAVQPARILYGSINSPGAFTSIGSYAVSTLRPSDIAIDQPNQKIYYTLLPTGAASAAASIGVWKMNEDGTGLTQVIGGYATSIAANTPNALALDLSHNLIFYTEGATVSGTSRILVGNALTGTKSGALISHNIGTLVSDLAVHNGTLYYTTINGGTVASNNIIAVPITYTGSGTTASATLGSATTLYAGANALVPSSLAIDPVSNRIYTVGNPGITAPGTVAVSVGTITGGGAMQTFFTQTNGTIGVNGSGLFFETAPTVTASGTVTLAVGGSAVAAAPSAGVTMPNGFTLKSATVEITGGNFTGDGDTLTATTSGSNITASFSGDKLSLSGIDTAANYQAVLRSVAYKSTATDPANGGVNKTRTLTWTVNDGVIASSSPTTVIDIHGRPTVSASGTVSFTGGGSAVTANASLTVSNPYSANLASATVAVGNFLSGDSLNFVNQGGITGSYSVGTGTLSLTGVATLATYQTALRSITYSYSPGNADPTGGGTNTSRTLNWTINDGVVASTAATSNLSIIHAAPTIATSGTATYSISSTSPVLDSGLTVSAPNSSGNLAGASVVVGGFLSGDILNFINQGGITGSYGTGTGTLSLGGTASTATYQTALRSITYSFNPSNGDPSAGLTKNSRTISWKINDGVANSGTTTSAISVIRSAPTITTSGTITYGIGHTPTVLDPALTVASPHSLGLLTGATVAITGGSFVGEADQITATTAGTSISFSYNTTTDVATLSGSDTLANYQAVLRSLTISSSSTNPTNGGANAQRTFSWAVTDGVQTSATSQSFALVDDPSVPCFVAGTRIATNAGLVPVECLRKGDMVLLLSGGSRPIRWIGYRHLDLTRHPMPEEACPILIRANALAAGVPTRDLRVSPEHAMFLDGGLVPARLLVNGGSIVQELAARRVSYYHVELDEHDVLLAEGAAAESYLDTGNRGLFENTDEPMQLHPRFADGQAGRVGRSCATFYDQAEHVQPIWRELADRSVAIGYALPDPPALTNDPGLTIEVSGRVFQPVSRSPDLYTFVLPAMAGTVRLVSRAIAPSALDRWITDRRRLGIAMRAITLQHGDEWDVIPPDHPGLTDGWWAHERDGLALWRWTKGNAVLPVALHEPTVMEIRFGTMNQYIADDLPRRDTAEPAREVGPDLMRSGRRERGVAQGGHLALALTA